MRRRLFADQQVSHVTWIPGRLLHIRHSAAKLHLDIIVGYQWVWQEKHAERTARLRHHFWHQLSPAEPPATGTPYKECSGDGCRSEHTVSYSAGTDWPWPDAILTQTGR